jgi:hypothetical protein
MNKTMLMRLLALLGHAVSGGVVLTCISERTGDGIRTP